MKNILIEDKKGNISKYSKNGIKVNLSESLAEINEANGDQNIVEGIILSNNMKVSEEALYELMNEGYLSEENVMRITEANNNTLTIAERRAAYALALEAHDPIMDKIRSVQAAKMVLKEEVFKRYGSKAKMRLNKVMKTIQPSISSKIQKGIIAEV